ncbi:DUF992 domain-containing protein [Rhizobium sp. KVB221]|uniref:DUF992 domain-containing protein n=1 Tax=Rhizobium setariae TaxID=2801340 RepID=A0A937CJP1_9HYPH|nr:DUF992 domain-containing protein [Rhizobium setariae]MBL0371315.1 DUF992 domain-containing protein [Rhizobium setariae]
MKRLLSIATVLASLLVNSGDALAAKSVNLGMLVCDMSKGIGLIIIEKQKMTCEFRPVSGQTVLYTGKITDVGIELGEVKEGHMIWGVFAAALTDMQPGALAGHYGGVEADAALGLGVGANALIGGTGKGFILQPLSVEGEVGVNIAAGVRTVTLDFVAD